MKVRCISSIDKVITGRRRWTVVRGDCLDALRGMPAACVDAVICDPPYGVSWDGHTSQARKQRFARIANDERPFIWWLADAFRVSRAPGCLACFCSPSTQEVFATAIAAAGWRVRSHVVWNRLVHGVGDTGAAFAPMHDVIWFATKGRYRFPGLRLPSVLDARKLAAHEKPHPTPKPPELLRRLVESLTPPDGLILDPTCGAGSTGVGALLAGRRFVGIEIDPAHAAEARRILKMSRLPPME